MAQTQTHSPVPFPSSQSTATHTPTQWDATTGQVKFADYFASSAPAQSTSSSSQQKAQQQSPERPSQPHTPLTPPLTPASANSLSGGVSVSGDPGNLSTSAFSTPARGPAAPPPTPSSAGLLSSTNMSASRLGPPSPVAVGTSSDMNSTAGSMNGWPAPSPTESRFPRPSLHHLDVQSMGNPGTNGGVSPLRERRERSVDFNGPLPHVDHVPDFRSTEGMPPEGSSGGERFLLVGNVPNDVKEDELKSAFYSLEGFMGVCVRFLETKGIVILAFYDSRFTLQAERQIFASGQTFFNGRGLQGEKLGTMAVKELMGDSEFINKTEGEVVVAADGNIDAGSLQSIVAGFGELRAFSQASSQVFLAEFYDCRNVKDAMSALNGRSFFGIRLHVAPKRSTSKDLLNRIPFQLVSENGPHHGYTGSQPTSPLATTESFCRNHADTCQFSTAHPDQAREKHDFENNGDMSNSSPFHGSRALPLISPLSHSHSLAALASGRRTSTGSVGHLGSSLHQSTSEQDLRRRAAVNNNAAYGDSVDGWIGDHARRTSDTFCFDALRRATGDLSGPVVQVGHIASAPFGRSRTRAISESSASPRVTSPSDGFSTAGMDVVLPGEVPATPEHIASTHQGDRDRDSDADRSVNAHSRFPTSSDSSLGGPHTPSPGPVTYNMPSLYVGSPSVMGLPPMPPTPHHGSGQYYLGSPLGTTASSAGMRFGYSPQGPRYSPGGLSVHSSSSSSSLLTPSESMMYSPHTRHPYMRGALDVSRDPPNERNQVDLERIAAGLDTRTTVMIKNIPNKLTDKDLIEYINRVCPRKIDFLYLRMDFQNGCNVGYAFVNFIHVEDLLRFAKTKLGVKWNMYSSEKVLQMSYANYQGKEALVEKFKNSCVMDERESWRPKIFYSSGPNQGLPEPFPAPTHYRRKERSAQNRGALFLPSAGAHSHGSSTVSEIVASSGMISSPFRRPNQHPQNLARQDRC